MQYPMCSKVPDYRRRRPPSALVRRRHRLIRVGSTLSALEQALKPDVESLQREPTRYRPNFRSTRRRRLGVLSGHAPRWRNIVDGGHRCRRRPPSVPRSRFNAVRSENPARRTRRISRRRERGTTH